MTHRTIGYHTRLSSDNSVKISGGSFGGAVDHDTIERLVNNMFTVKVRPSGTPVFVNRAGQEVSLYITVDPTSTTKGKIALAEHRLEQQKLADAESEREAHIQTLLAQYSTEHLIQILTHGIRS